MKVAVCYSGLYRHYDGWKENHEVLTQHADVVVYSTWDGENGEPRPRPDPCHVVYPEPDMHYNPFQTEEIRTKYPDFYRNHYNNIQWPWITKQILAHQAVCDDLDDDIDIVVRMRYDVTLGQKHDWLSFIKDSYENDRLVAFGSWSGGMDKDTTICDQLIPTTPETNTKVVESAPDFLHIHPRHKLRKRHAFELHEAKLLRPATRGFYQVLCEPWPNPENRKMYGGGVGLTRYLHDPSKWTGGGVTG